MGPQRERLIDLAATAILLAFAWAFNQETPGLSGVVIAAAIQFWLVKGVPLKTPTDHELHDNNGRTSG